MPCNPTFRTSAVRRDLAADSVDSTSLWLRREIASRAETHPEVTEFLTVAATQTGGIGRFGRAWASPRGGLWMSWARRLDPSSAPGSPLPAAASHQFLRGLSLRVACAVRDAVIDTSSHPHDLLTRLQLKWPNDLMALQGDGQDRSPVGTPRKVGGILIERITGHPATSGDRSRSEWLIVGVGINANFTIEDLPAELRSTATTLLEEFGLRWKLEQLAARIADSLSNVVEHPAAHDVSDAINAFQKNMVGLYEAITVSMPDGSRLAGTLIGLDPHDGLAMIRTVDGETTTVAPGAVIMHPCLPK